MSPAARWAGSLTIFAAFIWSVWSTEVSAGRLLDVPFMPFPGAHAAPPERVGRRSGRLATLQIAVVGLRWAQLWRSLAVAAAGTAPRGSSMDPQRLTSQR